MDCFKELQHYLDNGFSFFFGSKGDIKVSIMYAGAELVTVYSGDKFDHACLSCDAWIQLNS